MTINLLSDKVRVTGPKVDGGYTVSFEVGEDMQAEVAKCVCIPQQTTISLEIKA